MNEYYVIAFTVALVILVFLSYYFNKNLRIAFKSSAFNFEMESSDSQELKNHDIPKE